MKWVFLVGLVCATLVMSLALRQNRRLLPYAAFALGLSLFVENYLHLLASPISWATWSGISRGVELTLSDGIAFAMLMASRPARSPTRLKAAFGFFLFAFAVSTIASHPSMPNMFVGWDMLRTFVAFLAVTRATATEERVPASLMTGMIVGLSINAAVAAQQYLSGVDQAPGWFGHQNLLGFSAHFVAYPAFAAFLGGFYRKRMLLAIFASLVIAFTGGSRATIGLTLIGLFLTAIFSHWHQRSGRKAAIVIASLLGLFALSPLLIAGVDRRTVEQRVSSNEQREAMKAAARMIVSDHPFGIGANNYVLVANVGGYSERAGVTWASATRSVPVHNSYYLGAAEMGWLGLFAMLSVLLAAFSVAVRALRKIQKGLAGELSAGIAVTVLIVAVHAYYEWTLLTHLGEVLLVIELGMVSGWVASLPRSFSDKPVQVPNWKSVMQEPALPSST